MGYVYNEGVEMGGSPFRKESSKALVCFWEVADGDYTNANHRVLFFDRLEDAEEFERRNNWPPECPCLLPFSNPKVDELYNFKEYGENGTTVSSL